MNKIMLIGNLTRDPESNTTQSGANFTRFTIAVNRPFTSSTGERVADYFDIITWRGLAERCAKYIFKGSKVGIVGSVQRRQYEDRDGIKRTSFDVVADEVEFLTPKNNTGAPREQSGYMPEEPHDIAGMQPVDSDDLPF
ncbi:MAG: single-stranded DNA-binding protein [Clostridiales bacterium]|nr:single-stranded DNA-binding protein [Clostridiales bacterium]